MKAIKYILAVLALALVGMAASNEEAPRSLSSVGSTEATITADSVSMEEFSVIRKDVDVYLTVDADANTTFIIQGSNLYGEWLPLDTLSYTGTALTTTLADAPAYLRIYVETAASTNTQRVGWKVVDAK